MGFLDNGFLMSVNSDYKHALAEACDGAKEIKLEMHALPCWPGHNDTAGAAGSRGATASFPSSPRRTSSPTSRTPGTSAG